MERSKQQIIVHRVEDQNPSFYKDYARDDCTSPLFPILHYVVIIMHEANKKRNDATKSAFMVNLLGRSHQATSPHGWELQPSDRGPTWPASLVMFFPPLNPGREARAKTSAVMNLHPDGLLCQIISTVSMLNTYWRLPDDFRFGDDPAYLDKWLLLVHEKIVP